MMIYEITSLTIDWSVYCSGVSYCDMAPGSQHSGARRKGHHQTSRPLLGNVVFSMLCAKGLKPMVSQSWLGSREQQ
jgi:hypothetical protein